MTIKVNSLYLILLKCLNSLIYLFGTPRVALLSAEVILALVISTIPNTIKPERTAAFKQKVGTPASVQEVVLCEPVATTLIITTPY